MSQIEAPFTPEQVVALNAYQRSGVFHPFTCGKRHDHPADEIDKGCLIATIHGWICPVCWDGSLNDLQKWAHSFMAKYLSATEFQKASGFRMVKQRVNTHYEWLHKYCHNNRDILSNSKNACCFYCEKFFKSSEIKEWVGKNFDQALCSCGINSVIPAVIKHCVGDEMEEYIVTQEDLKGMHKYWFRKYV